VYQLENNCRKEGRPPNPSVLAVSPTKLVFQLLQKEVAEFLRGLGLCLEGNTGSAQGDAMQSM
jgi:hypothetical protein